MPAASVGGQESAPVVNYSDFGSSSDEGEARIISCKASAGKPRRSKKPWCKPRFDQGGNYVGVTIEYGPGRARHQESEDEKDEEERATCRCGNCEEDWFRKGWICPAKAGTTE